jgi:hypothetical protein
MKFSFKSEAAWIVALSAGLPVLGLLLMIIVLLFGGRG